VVQVHDVSDGRKMAVMQEEFSDWCRCFDWHPTRPEIALCAGKDAWVWNPSTGPNGKVLQHFKLDDGRKRLTMSGIRAVCWMDEGRLLGIESSDGSSLIYNVEGNAKELFWRPAGTTAGHVMGGLCGIFQDKEEHDVYLSVDGDGNARFWRTSVAAYPSWWEKDPVPAAKEKKAFPETGKYVKITKTSGKATTQQNPDKDNWAGNGAALWTAE
jgi:WD40 repeat protein